MSVYVKYDPWGRMGNRMFQYSFGYILSKIKQTELYADGLINFNIIDKKSNNRLIEPIYTRAMGDHFVDINLLIKHPGDIIIDSFLQNANYYIPYVDILKKIFIQETELEKNSDHLVIHIREGDYTLDGSFLGYDIYKNIIDQTKFNNIKIVTDNSNCETVQRLISEGCELVTSGIVDRFTTDSDERAMIDFYTLLGSSNIAISQSSFSWWPAFLGTHNNIFIPLGQNTRWKLQPCKDEVNLFFDFGNSHKIII